MAEGGWFHEFPENPDLPEMMPDAGVVPVLNPNELDLAFLTGDRLYELLNGDQAQEEMAPDPTKEEPMMVQEEGEEEEPEARREVEAKAEGEEELGEAGEPDQVGWNGGEGEEPRFKCDICFAEFRSCNARNGHKKKHRAFCASCNVTFDSRGRYDIHIRTDHGPTFRCKICKQSSHEPRDLVIHVLDHKELKEVSSMVYGQIESDE